MVGSLHIETLKQRTSLSPTKQAITFFFSCQIQKKKPAWWESHWVGFGFRMSSWPVAVSLCTVVETRVMLIAETGVDGGATFADKAFATKVAVATRGVFGFTAPADRDSLGYAR